MRSASMSLRRISASSCRKRPRLGPEDGAAARLGLEALQDVLLEGVVGAAMRRGAVETAAPGVEGEGVAVPLLYGVGRIGQHNIEAHEAVDFHKLRLGQRVAALDAEVLDAVEQAVHPGDGGGHEVEDGVVLVELGGGVAGVVCELLDEILVALA